MQCLAELCTSNGAAIPATQELICQAALEDENNHDLFYETAYTHNALTVHWTNQDGTKHSCALKSIMGPDAPPELLSNYTTQLNLFAQMCLDRQYVAIKDLAVKLPVDLVLTCIVDQSLPNTLRAAFCRLMLHLHVDAEPQELVTPVTYARLWADIPLELNVERYSSGNNNRSSTGINFGPTMAFVSSYLDQLEQVGFAVQVVVP